MERHEWLDWRNWFRQDPDGPEADSINREIEWALDTPIKEMPLHYVIFRHPVVIPFWGIVSFLAGAFTVLGLSRLLGFGG